MDLFCFRVDLFSDDGGILFLLFCHVSLFFSTAFLWFSDLFRFIRSLLTEVEFFVLLPRFCCFVCGTDLFFVEVPLLSTFCGRLLGVMFFGTSLFFMCCSSVFYFTSSCAYLRSRLSHSLRIRSLSCS